MFKKACMILDTSFPPDIRVEKEARTLIREGYEVHLLCIGEKNQTEIVRGIVVHRFVIDKSSIFKRILHTRPLINIFHINYWVKKLCKLHKKENFSVFHCHDLTTAPYTLLAGKKANIPVILDMHENYPEAQRTYRSLHKKTTSILTIISYWLNRIIEKICISQSFHVFTVVKERKKQLVSQGFDESKISILSNTVDIKHILRFPIDHDLSKRYKDKFVITYIGGFGPHRGLETLIQSIPLINKKISNLCLLLVGGKIPEINRLKILCEELKIDNFVEFIGWINFPKIPSYINISKICIIPHIKSGHTDTTLPHKLFQYMLFSKPVIATDCLPLKRIIQKCKCGIIVKSGDSKSIAQAIFTIFNDSKLATKLGKNGKKAILEEYNWEKSEQILLMIYKRIFRLFT